MAILPGFPGFEVVVRVNGVALQEHQDVYEAEADTPDRITRYVQATSGAKFDILFTQQQCFQLPSHDIVARLYLDGYNTESIAILKQDMMTGNFRSKLSRSITGSNGDYKARPFMFAELDISMLHDQIHSAEH